MKITVISDTHGSLPQNLRPLLCTSDYVIHAGDIGSQALYRELMQLNPNTCCVRGNCDRGIWAAGIRETLRFHLDGFLFYVIHNQTGTAYRPEDADIVICGHTHRYMLRQTDGRTVLNPGSCSRPRDGAASCAVITTENGSVRVQKVAVNGPAAVR